MESSMIYLGYSNDKAQEVDKGWCNRNSSLTFYIFQHNSVLLREKIRELSAVDNNIVVYKEVMINDE